ncbi:unnamed protein product [Laminaria digitata]
MSMASVSNASALFDGALDGNMRKVKAALAAGANVNGCPELPYTPIMAATAAHNVSMVRFLIKQQGVDLDRCADHDLPCPSTEEGIMPGDRALHIAAKLGNVEIVRLLNRGGADLNATDTRGRTPLFAACACLKECVPVARVLLEVGANPALADGIGCTPLHAVAQNGLIDLLDIVYTGAPDTLIRYSTNGRTPLFFACANDHENMVSRLLSLGAMQWVRPHNPNMCPLLVATAKGYEGVVRVLIREGMPAVGRMMSMPYAIHGAIQSSQVRILRLLLAVDGEAKTRSYWANIELSGRQPLQLGSALCCPASVNILLAAGADETVRDWEGLAPRDVVGMGLELDGVRMDREKEIAVRRMLEHGPAYRARSWAWPAEEGDGGGSGDGGAVVTSPPVAPKAPVSVRIFVRPKDDGKFFGSLIHRYCRKG